MVRCVCKRNKVVNTWLIFFGAGLGGVFRYWISHGIYLLLGRQFPYGTLLVNVTGSFLMGLFFVLILDRFDGAGAQLRAFVLIGILGGYTTFSSFAIETLNLLEGGEWLSALVNIILSVTVSILAVWLGVLGGRQL